MELSIEKYLKMFLLVRTFQSKPCLRIWLELIITLCYLLYLMTEESVSWKKLYSCFCHIRTTSLSMDFVELATEAKKYVWDASSVCRFLLTQLIEINEMSNLTFPSCHFFTFPIQPSGTFSPSPAACTKYSVSGPFSTKTCQILSPCCSSSFSTTAKMFHCFSKQTSLSSLN